MSYKVRQEDLIGEIKHFPIEVVRKMVEKQVEYGSKADVTVFQKNKSADDCEGGFSWAKTVEGYEFWDSVIDLHNFDLFFEKYPRDNYQPISEETAKKLSDSMDNTIAALRRKDIVDFLNDIEEKMILIRSILNEEEPEGFYGELPAGLVDEVDFSILNDTDVFYLKSKQDDYLFTGGNPITKKVKGCIVEDGYKFIDRICDKNNVMELRKANDIEKEYYYALYPELRPIKVGDWVAVWDDKDIESLFICKYKNVRNDPDWDNIVKVDITDNVKEQIDEFLKQQKVYK